MPLLPARDHKRIGDGDTGPNTGGMGAYAPTTLVDATMLERIMATILRPTARALVERGIIYRGILYAGLILTSDGPKVIEFNCRFGDPETQVVLPLLDADLLALCDATAQGDSRQSRLPSAGTTARVSASYSPPAAIPARIRPACRSPASIPLARTHSSSMPGRNMTMTGQVRHERWPCPHRCRRRTDAPRGPRPRVRERRACPLRGRPVPPRHRRPRIEIAR